MYKLIKNNQISNNKNLKKIACNLKVLMFRLILY